MAKKLQKRRPQSRPVAPASDTPVRRRTLVFRPGEHDFVATSTDVRLTGRGTYPRGVIIAVSERHNDGRVTGKALLPAEAPVTLHPHQYMEGVEWIKSQDHIADVNAALYYEARMGPDCLIGESHFAGITPDVKKRWTLNGWLIPGRVKNTYVLGLQARQAIYNHFPPHEGQMPAVMGIPVMTDDGDFGGFWWRTVFREDTKESSLTPISSEPKAVLTIAGYKFTDDNVPQNPDAQAWADWDFGVSLLVDFEDNSIKMSQRLLREMSEGVDEDYAFAVANALSLCAQALRSKDNEDD